MLNPSNANTAHWGRQRDLFEAACALPTGDQAAFVNESAADSPDLAQSLLRMLAAHARFSGQTDQAHLQLLDQVDAMQTQSDPSTIAPGAQIGAFRLIKEIGRGGMGVVWKASRIDDVAQMTAIKILPPHRWDAASRARFQAERDALAGLEHPGIARLIDAGSFQSVGQSEDTPFYVMEYVEGISITDYASAQNLSTHERVRLICQVLDAVDYAHGMLLIHRDLKPSNILVNAAGQVKLIDFGIAKNLSSANNTVQTQTQQRFFSPSNAAPEQLRGQANSVAVDIYQLGAVLYELLSAKPLFDFQNASASEVERSILERVPAAPSRISTRPRSGIDADLDAICLHCLRKEPNLRYASVAALQQDLHRTLAHRGISIRQGQGCYRAGKFLRRNALGVGFALTVLVLMLGFSWTSFQQSKQIARERDVAVMERRNAQETSEFLLSTFRTLDSSEVGAPPKTIAEYLKNILILLNLNKAIGFSQRKILLLTLARAAAGKFDSVAELRMVLSELSDIAIKTKDNVLSAEVLLIQAASESSAHARVKYVEQLKRISLTDPELTLRIEIEKINFLAGALGANDERKIQELTVLLKNLLTGKEDFLIKSKLIGRIYLNTISSLASRMTDLKSGIGIIKNSLEIIPYDSLEKAEALSNLSYIYRIDKQYENALITNQKATEIHVSILGEDSEKIEKNLDARAKTLMDMGRLVEGRIIFEQAIAHAERFGETRYAAVAAISMNLGLRCENMLKDPVCAQKNLKRAIDMGLKAWGEDDPNVAMFRAQYARAMIFSNPKDAHQNLHLAVKILGDEPQTTLLLAFEHLQKNRLDLATLKFTQLCRSVAINTEDVVEARVIKELEKATRPSNCKPSPLLQSP